MNERVIDDEPVAAPEFRRIARAIEFVAANVRNQPSLAEIAAAAHWSEYHFAREFRRWTGISPKLWLQGLSLTAAQQSLATSGPCSRRRSTPASRDPAGCTTCSSPWKP